MKKAVELDTKQWALVDGLLHAATGVIGRDAKRERVTALEPQAKEALLWTNEQITVIRAIISRAVFRGDDTAEMRNPDG